MYVNLLDSYVVKSNLMLKTNTSNLCYWAHGYHTDCCIGADAVVVHYLVHNSLYSGGSFCICYLIMCAMFYCWSWTVIFENINTENGSMLLFPFFDNVFIASIWICCSFQGRQLNLLKFSDTYNSLCVVKKLLHFAQPDVNQ